MAKGVLLTADLGQAPDFELLGIDGRAVRLSDYAGCRNVLLVFNRGFY
jgi:peroxiredoxin